VRESPTRARERNVFSMRSDRWKKAYVFEVNAALQTVQLVQDGAQVATLTLAALERVALRRALDTRSWQWLLAFVGEDAVRALPHDDDFAGHAAFAALLRNLPSFDHRAYAAALTTPAPEPEALYVLWRR